MKQILLKVIDIKQSATEKEQKWIRYKTYGAEDKDRFLF